MTTENSQQPDQSQPTPAPTSTSNSAGTQPRPRRPECPRCKNTGFMGWKQPENYPLSEVTFCECDYGLLSRDYWQRRANAKHQQRLDTLFQSAGIPPHFRSFTFDSLLARAGDDQPAEVGHASAEVDRGAVVGMVSGCASRAEDADPRRPHPRPPDRGDPVHFALCCRRPTLQSAD